MLRNRCGAQHRRAYVTTRLRAVSYSHGYTFTIQLVCVWIISWWNENNYGRSCNFCWPLGILSVGAVVGHVRYYSTSTSSSRAKKKERAVATPRHPRNNRRKDGPSPRTMQMFRDSREQCAARFRGTTISCSAADGKSPATAGPKCQI